MNGNTCWTLLIKCDNFQIMSEYKCNCLKTVIDILFNILNFILIFNEC